MSFRTAIRIMSGILILSICVVGVVEPSEARSKTPGKYFRSRNHDAKQGLTPKKSHYLARKLARMAARHPFIQKHDTQVKIAIMEANVRVRGLVSDRQYTDQLLGELLDQPFIFITNQDYTVSLKADFKLISYDRGSLMRKRGLLTGAYYYYYGTVDEVSHTDKNGRLYQAVEGRLGLYNIKTNELMYEVRQLVNKKRVKVNP